MIHPPKGKNAALVKIVTDGLIGVLENKTSFSRDELTDMMKPGKEKWLTADEMESSGFIDKGGIIKTGKKDFFKKKVINAVEDLKIYAQFVEEENPNRIKSKIRSKSTATLTRKRPTMKKNSCQREVPRDKDCEQSSGLLSRDSRVCRNLFARHS